MAWRSSPYDLQEQKNNHKFVKRALLKEIISALKTKQLKAKQLKTK